jgi:tRNA-splicing ligase RtcB
MARATPVGSGLKALSAHDDKTGGAYLRDMEWGRRYAAASRFAMAGDVAAMLGQLAGVRADWQTLVNIDHNHVVREQHGERTLWVHRKGAMAAGAGVLGLLPGSMATASFHVEGRGCVAAYGSSAHGAGRALSREKARKAVAERDLHRQMAGIWYDYRMAAELREEAPSAYKDVHAVLRAQRELVTVTKTLRPLLNYKGR